MSKGARLATAHLQKRKEGIATLYMSNIEPCKLQDFHHARGLDFLLPSNDSKMKLHGGLHRCRVLSLLVIGAVFGYHRAPDANK